MIERDRPLFIVGTSRSGTAMLRAALNSSPKVQIAGETHYFDDLRPRIGNPTERLTADQREACERYFLALAHRPYGHQGRPTQSRLTPGQLRAAAQGIGEGTDAYFEAFCRLDSTGAIAGRDVRWGEKTPRHAFRLNDILARYPGSQAIYMLRDPRAVVASYRDWQNQGGFDLDADPSHAGALEAERRRSAASYDPSVMSLLWRAAAKSASLAQATFGTHRVRIQRYEDVVTDPTGQIEAICRWADVEFHADMLAMPMHNSSFSTFLPGAGVSTAPVDRWKHKLTPPEIATVQLWCRAQMSSAGYEPEPVSLRPKEAVAAVTALGLSSVRAIHSNRNRTGNLAAYVWRRARLALSAR